MGKKFNPVTEVQLEEPNDSRSPISPEKQAELDAERAEVIQSARDKRLAIDKKQVDWRNKIAAAADANRNRSMDEVLSGEVHQDEHSSRNQIGVFETDNEVDEDQSEEVVENSQEEAIPHDNQVKITKIIGGKEVTRTIDEWMEIASKVEEADVYYAESVRRLHEQKQVEVVGQDEKEVLRGLAKKIQLGSEEEAESALLEVVNRAAFKANVAKQQQDVHEAGKAVYLAFQRDYDDVMKDPVMNAALISMEQRLIEEGRVFDADEVTNFDKRLRYVGDQVREWKRGLADVSVKQEKRQDLINKKAQITNLNTASSKQTSKQEQPLSEREGRDIAVQQMFASRKKKAF